MKKITLLDTAICTENMGDKIIMDSANRVIKETFNDSFYVHLPTHDKIGRMSYKHIKTSDFIFACGTNMLSSNMNRYNQWKINLIDSIFLDKAILLGVGWWQYQEKPNQYTRLLLKRVLHPEILHSVRDNYTFNMLRSIGIENVINTSCPTMWDLTPEHCDEIPKKKGNKAIITLTNYNQDFLLDKKFVDIVNENYDKVYYWVQAYEDLPYLKDKLKITNFEIVPPTLEALDKVFKENEDLDYIGTRLHAGIRALQFKRRSIILGIDNRATEKSKDFNLKVLNRKNIEELNNLINSEFKTDINIPLENINKWKSQFI